MERIVGFLSRRPAVSAALATAFFVGTMLAHDRVQSAVYRFAHWIGRGADEPLARWNAFVTAVGAPLMLLCAAAIGLAVWRHPCRTPLAAAWALILLLVVASYNALFVMNSELVHFPQFAMLAMLLFQIIGRFGETMFWCGLLGAIDEGYQYWWLSRAKAIYYDFNDVVLNMLGAGLGLLLLLTFAPRGVATHSRGARATGVSRARPSTVAVVTALALVLAVIAGAATGTLRESQPHDNGRSAIVLRRCGTSPSFWVRTTWDKTFHELSPLEGTSAAVMLIVLFAAFDTFAIGRASSGELPTAARPTPHT